MKYFNRSELPTAWQVCRAAIFSWQRIVQAKPILAHLKHGVRQLDPPASPTQFRRIWDGIERLLAEIFDGGLRPVLGTDHNRAWNHLFLLLNDLADQRKVT